MSQNPSTGAESKIRPPYLSYKTFKKFLDSFASREDVPSHIDRSFMPSSMSGGNQVGVIAALKFFGLISEAGEPREKLYAYVESEGEARKEVLRAILADAYVFLLAGLDIERATTSKVIEKFKDAGMSGDTVRKAILFFQFAAKDSGMKISPHIKPYMGSRTARPTKARGKGANVADDGQEDDTDEEGGGQGVERARPDKTPYQVLIDILSPDMEEDEQDAVWTLIRFLKKREAMEGLEE